MIKDAKQDEIISNEFKKTLLFFEIQPKNRQLSQIEDLLFKLQDVPFFKKYIQLGFTTICHQCLRHMVLEVHEDGQEIFSQGTLGENFYVIIQGQVGIYDNLKDSYQSKKQENISKDGQQSISSQVNQKNAVKVLESGESFGELSLIFNKPRLAGAKAHQKSYLGVLDKKKFELILKDQEQAIISKEVQYLNCLPLFEGCLFSHLREIYINSFKIASVKNEIIFSEGDLCDAAYIIKSGDFSDLTSLFALTKIFKKFYHQEQEDDQSQTYNPKEVSSELQIFMRTGSIQNKPCKEIQMAILTVGELFGEENLIRNENRSFGVKCISPKGELLMIKKDQFIQKVMTLPITSKFILERCQSKEMTIQKSELNIVTQMNLYSSYLFRDDSKIKQQLDISKKKSPSLSTNSHSKLNHMRVSLSGKSIKQMRHPKNKNSLSQDLFVSSQNKEQDLEKMKDQISPRDNESSNKQFALSIQQKSNKNILFKSDKKGEFKSSILQIASENIKQCSINSNKVPSKQENIHENENQRMEQQIIQKFFVLLEQQKRIKNLPKLNEACFSGQATHQEVSKRLKTLKEKKTQIDYLQEANQISQKKSYEISDEVMNALSRFQTDKKRAEFETLLINSIFLPKSENKSIRQSARDKFESNKSNDFEVVSFNSQQQLKINPENSQPTVAFISSKKRISSNCLHKRIKSANVSITYSLSPRERESSINKIIFPIDTVKRQQNEIIQVNIKAKIHNICNQQFDALPFSFPSEKKEENENSHYLKLIDSSTSPISSNKYLQKCSSSPSSLSPSLSLYNINQLSGRKTPSDGKSIKSDNKLVSQEKEDIFQKINYVASTAHQTDLLFKKQNESGFSFSHFAFKQHLQNRSLKSKKQPFSIGNQSEQKFLKFQSLLKFHNYKQQQQLLQIPDI